MDRVTKHFKRPDKSWDLVKVLLVPILLWGSYVTFQAYEVGSNKTAILETKATFRRDIDANKAEIEKNNGILHGRISKEAAARESQYFNLQAIVLDTWKVMLGVRGCPDVRPKGQLDNSTNKTEIPGEKESLF